MESSSAYRMIWQERLDGGASLVRLYGASPDICLPPQIAGRPLVEIAPYCFATAQRVPNGSLRETYVGDSGGRAYLQELYADAIEAVSLPDSVETIGNCAFYNCKKISGFCIGSALRNIGSDAFMNTLAFHQLTIRCAPDQASGVRRILAQISSDMEVRFVSRAGTEAVLLYPEYYESYDEIAPAHLFGRSISGEGFRARQCIKDGIVDFAGYDAVFLQACVEESEATLARMAMNRLRYPYGLSNQNREVYQNYLKMHMEGIALRLTQNKDLEALQFLCGQKLLYGTALLACIQTAAKLDWAEGTASLLQQNALGKAQQKRRYELDGV